MSIDFSGVRYIENGEPVDKSVLNRPIEDLASILENSVFDSLLDSNRINIASASNIDLSTGSAANTRHLNITGTTAITGFTVPAGKTYLVRFAAATTLTNNSAIVTQTGANIITAAGDTCWIRSIANNVVEVANYKHVILPVAQGGTGASTSTGSGGVVLSASPALTGNPTVPTQSESDNSQRVASTAFVQSQKVASTSDATAGKTVTVGYMGLGSNTAPIENADCNNLTRAGFYTIGASAANRPAYMTVGVARSGLLVLVGGESTRCSQMHFADNSSSVRVSIRHLTSGGWGAWVEINHSGNFSPSDYLRINDTAATATKLATPRTIGGVSFDGTANINLPGVNAAGNQSTSGNAASATKLAAARTINGVAFDGSADITVADSTKLSLAGGTLTGPLTSPNIRLNRSGAPASGISWHSTGYNAWQDYMAEAGIAGQGVNGNVTAPAGTLVTSWARRSFIESVAGCGWTFESGSNTSTAPTVVAEIRSSDGSAKFAGSVTAAQFNGSGAGLWSLHAGNLSTGTVPDARLSGTYTGMNITGNAGTANRAGVLNWTNYGGGQGVGNGSHVIFDASNSVSPSGTAVNNTNSVHPWASTYPTLMGWNGSTTHGVRVDSARVADSLTASPALTGVPTAPTPASGTRSTAIATMQNFANEFGSSLAPSGWQRLPSGLIMQWGVTGATGTYTFPIAFPTAFLSIAIACRANDTSGVTGTPSVTAFSYAGASGSRYIALGY